MYITKPCSYRLVKSPLILLVFSLFFLSIAAPGVQGEVVRYTDDSGQVHYTNDQDQIPLKYRDQLKKQKPLPAINKVPAITTAPSNKTDYSASEYGKKKVEIFVAAWCAYCRKLEDFLRSNRIHYKKYDIEKNRQGRKIYQQLGGGGVPIARIGSTVIRGYNPTAIKQALQIK